MNSEIAELFGCKGIEIKPHRFAVYLPSENEDGLPIEEKRYEVLCKMTGEFLCVELGGATIYQAEGMWVNDPKNPESVKKPHRENVQVAESYCKKSILKDKAKRVRDFVNALAIEFKQAEMVCVIDGEMAFFKPEKEYRKIHAWIGAKPMNDRDPASVSGFVFNFLETAGIPFLAKKTSALKATGVESSHGPIA
jgi:hypothetical protein